MLKKYITKKNIRFRKKDRLRILFFLFLNRIRHIIWLAEKKLKRINHPVIHLYTVCWNEEKIIPFFFRHYNEFVDRFFIYDNYSDDKTEQLLNAQPHVVIRKYDTGGTFNDYVHQEIKNNTWKKSRGKCDYVIVCDIDELLYHPHMKEFLRENKSSIVRPQGFEMVLEIFPDNTRKITEVVTWGKYNKDYSKRIFFDPYRIVEINYKPGAHEDFPEGMLDIKEDGDLKLLHYKNLGLDYVLNKIYSYRLRLSSANKKNNLGIHYNYEDQKIIDNFKLLIKSATKVIN